MKPHSDILISSQKFQVLTYLVQAGHAGMEQLLAGQWAHDTPGMASLRWDDLIGGSDINDETQQKMVTKETLDS